MFAFLPDHLASRWRQKADTTPDHASDPVISVSAAYGQTDITSIPELPPIDHIAMVIASVDRTHHEAFTSMVGAVKSAFLVGQFGEAVKGIADWQPQENGLPPKDAKADAPALRPVKRIPSHSVPAGRANVSLIAEHAEAIRSYMDTPPPLTSAARGSAATRLAQWLLMGLRSSEAGNRRQSARIAFVASARIITQDQQLTAYTLNVGPGGTLIDAGQGWNLPLGTAVKIDIDGLPSFKGQVADITPNGLHIAFTQEDPNNREAIGALPALMTRTETLNEPIMAAAMTLASSVTNAFSAALAWGTITPEALFANSGRPQIGDQTHRLEPELRVFYRDILQPLFTPLSHVPDNLYAMASACDGTLPLIAPEFENSDQIQDNLHSGWHTHRALRNRDGAMVQVYRDERPNACSGLIKDVSAPVIVAGRHWGCVRIGYDLPRP